MSFALINIGFVEINWIDLLDIVLVGFLLFQMYRLIRGSLAFNIFIGFIIVYFLWLLVRFSGMELLAGILNQFISVGVIALLIVFQPEIRKFLLYLGKSGQFKKSGFWSKLFYTNFESNALFETNVPEILMAIDNLKKQKNGALIVLSKTSRMQMIASSGVMLDSNISAKLLESIFEKNSPLHDGAVIIFDYKIVAANCVLPVSDNLEQANRLGMRHRAALGISEISDALTIIISEEKGTLSYTRNGRLMNDITIEELKNVLKKYFEVD